MPEIIPHHLKIENISVNYGDHTILDGVSFFVEHGSSLAVIGPNGAGKSTLFKAIVGLLPIESGKIWIHDQPYHMHKDCVAYVPQKEEIDWKFPVTVKDVVMMGRYNRIGWFNRPKKHDYEVVNHALEELKIDHIANSSIDELSGGQQQRVFLARAIAQEPHILIMDEPFTGIDTPTREVTFSLIERLKSRKVTVMVSTHDLNLAASRFDNVLLINRRLISVGPAKKVLTHQHMEMAFGNSFLVLDDGQMIMDECCHDHSHESLD